MPTARQLVWFFMRTCLAMFCGAVIALGQDLAVPPAEVPVDVMTLALAAALAVSELLASIPSVRANSIFQLVAGFLRKLVGK